MAVTAEGFRVKVNSGRGIELAVRAGSKADSLKVKGVLDYLYSNATEIYQKLLRLEQLEAEAKADLFAAAERPG